MEDFYMCECNRCGAKMSNHEFNSGHECKGMKPLSDLPFNILRKLAQGKITEEQAWEEAANA